MRALQRVHVCVCGGEAFLANYLLEPIKFDTRSKRKEDGKDFFFLKGLLI